MPVPRDLERRRQRAAEVRDTPAEKPKIHSDGRVTIPVGNVRLTFVEAPAESRHSVTLVSRTTAGQVHDPANTWVSDGDFKAAVRQATAILRRLRKEAVDEEGPEPTEQLSLEI